MKTTACSIYCITCSIYYLQQISLCFNFFFFFLFLQYMFAYIIFSVFLSQYRTAHIMLNSVWPLSTDYDSVSIRLSLNSFETAVPFLSFHLFLHYLLLLFQCPPPLFSSALLSSPHPTSSPIPFPSSVILLRTYALIFISSS